MALDDKIRVTQAGLRVMALPSWQASTTLMFGDDGTGVRTIRVLVEPLTAANSVYIAITGPTPRTATNADLLVNTYEPVTIDSRGFQKINVLSGLGTAFINIIPLENI